LSSPVLAATRIIRRCNVAAKLDESASLCYLRIEMATTPTNQPMSTGAKVAAGGLGLALLGGLFAAFGGSGKKPSTLGKPGKPCGPCGR
jgi:hypothetical protein